uniref:ADAM metallopeptidase with thrombospondin type 1 motif 3 n=1 Tax=Latimeria chalumnae TaxID=7897 RepID=H3AZW9_LATCH
EYGLVTPISTDSEGHYLSNILSATHKRRLKRDTSPNSEQLYFNVTAFGMEFHLRLQPNSRLVAPGAVVEWHKDPLEDGNGNRTGNDTERIWKKQLLRMDCAYVGDITDIPGASVAISNCDGLISYFLQSKHRVCVYFVYLFSVVCSFCHLEKVNVSLTLK